MAFLQQIIELLTAAPGSAIYHLVTLLALQAVLGIALWQWRRDRRDRFAWRIMIAAGAILALRLAIALAALAVYNDPLRAAGILPPLEQAVNTASALLLVWALAAPFARLPRLGDVSLVLLLTITGLLYLFFAQSWLNRMADGVVAGGYNSSEQATIWGIFQLLILGGGLLLLLWQRQRDWPLRSAIIAVLFIAHATHFWNYPEIIASASDIAYWVRLGNLIALPLLAALAYRHNLAELIAAQMASRPMAEQLAEFLKATHPLVESNEITRALQGGVEMARRLIPARLIILASYSPDSRDYLKLIGARSDPEDETLLRWSLHLKDWPAFRLAIQQQKGIELLPNGLGARQLHDFYQELGVAESGPLWVEPLLCQNQNIGLLLLTGQEEWPAWPAKQKSLAAPIAGFMARVIHNAQRHEQLLAEASHITLPADRENGPTPASGRLVALEQERDQAADRADNLAARLESLESQLLSTQQRNVELAAMLSDAQHLTTDERVAALQDEIATLRESLVEAEEAMALASAGDVGLSAEWVMLTITRYSADLEEAQHRLRNMEERLRQQDNAELLKSLTDLTERLRAPLTSVVAYTELMLSETLGILSKKQLNVLQRLQGNVEQIDQLLRKTTSLLAEGTRHLQADGELVDAREVVETVITHLTDALQARQLQLAMQFAPDTTAVVANREAVYRIALKLLQHVCQMAATGGQLTLDLHTTDVVEAGSNGDIDRHNFLHLAISGDALAASEDHAAGSSNGRPADNEPLREAQALTLAQGGRLWIDNGQGKNSYYVLLPLLEKRAEVA